MYFKKYSFLCRPLWNRVSVMKLYIQHMCPLGEAELANTHKHISALWTVSTRENRKITIDPFVADILSSTCADRRSFQSSLSFCASICLLIQAITFELLQLETLFSVCR